MGSGRVPIGVDVNESWINKSEVEGGELSHKITTSELPSHTHSLSSGKVSTKSLTGSVGNMAVQNKTQGLSASGITTLVNWENTVLGYAVDSTSISETGPTDAFNIDASHNHTLSGSTGSTGNSSSFSLLQPYVTCYMWKRTS